MKRKFNLILIMILLLAVATIGLVGCDGFNNKSDVESPSFIESNVEVGTNYIKINANAINIPHSDLEVEYRLNDGEWQSSSVFNNLTPGTEYTIYARTKENDEYKQSEATSIKVTTPKAEQIGVPNVTFTQEGKKITLNDFTENMEVSWDGADNYTAAAENVYNKNGEYTIKIRYKESQTHLVGAEQEIKVVISDFYGGTGEKDNPFLVTNFEEFKALMRGTCENVINYYKLENDIYFPAEAINIDDVYKNSQILLYGAHIDGNNKKVFNPMLTKNGSNQPSVGLFRSVGEVKDLTVVDAKILCNDNDTRAFGILAAYANVVTNCHVIGQIEVNNTSTTGLTSRIHIGGLVGELSNNIINTPAITNCSADVTINTTQNYKYSDEIYAGGIVGNFKFNNSNDFEKAVISNTSVNINATFASANKFTFGGIIGKKEQETKKLFEIKDCLVTGNVKYSNNYGNSDSNIIGGMAGDFCGNVINCISELNIEVADIADSGRKIINIAGIVGNDTPWSRTEDRLIENVLYCGVITISQDTKYILLNCDSVANSVSSGSLLIQNAWHAGILGAECEGTNSYPVDNEGDELTIAWQKQTLKLNEKVWDLQEGKLPKLKF